MYKNSELEKLTLEWGAARKITINGKISTQVLKLVEEFNKEYYSAADKDQLEDAIGDAIVVLTMINGLNNSKFINPITNITDQLVNMCKSRTERLDLITSVLNIHIGNLASDAIRDITDNIELNVSVVYKLLGLLAIQHNTSSNSCWNLAYNEIKDRTGYLNEDGAFIKD